MKSQKDLLLADDVDTSLIPSLVPRADLLDPYYVTDDHRRSFFRQTWHFQPIAKANFRIMEAFALSFEKPRLTRGTFRKGPT